MFSFPLEQNDNVSASVAKTVYWQQILACSSRNSPLFGCHHKDSKVKQYGAIFFFVEI